MFNELMNRTLTIKRVSSVNTYGELTTINLTIKCRLEIIQKQFDNGKGAIIDSEGVIYSTTKLLVNDGIVYNTIEYSVIKVDTVIDLFGNIQHYKAYLI